MVFYRMIAWWAKKMVEQKWLGNRLWRDSERFRFRTR